MSITEKISIQTFLNIRDDDGNRIEPSKKEHYTEKFGYMTRSLVKNNIVQQNVYVVFLALEYLCMMYYILRLADQQSFNKLFGSIETFLDVS